MNRSETTVGRDGVLPVPARQRLLEQRIEAAKERLAADLSRLGRVARGVEARALRGVLMVVLAVIALFDLLAGAVPSTAGRLAILAAGFAVIAAICAAVTVRGLRRVSEPGPHARVREAMPTGRRPPR